MRIHLALTLALLAAGIAAAQQPPMQQGTAGATGATAVTALQDRAERDNLFGDFSRTDHTMAGRWLSFGYDDRGALSNVVVATSLMTPPNDGAPAPADATGAGAMRVWDLIDVGPFRAAGPATGGTQATATLPDPTAGGANGTGIFALRGRTAHILVHNTPLGELDVVALEPVNVTLDPADGIVLSAAGDKVWTVQGNGLDARLVLVGVGPMQGTPSTGTDPETGAPWERTTIALERGEHLVFIARATGQTTFDDLVAGLASGNVAATLGLVGDGTTFLWHPLQLGVGISVDRAIPGELAVGVADNRATQSLCGPGATPPPAPDQPPGTVATGAPCAGYAVVFDVDLDSLNASGQDVRVLVDQQPMGRAASFGDALAATHTGFTTPGAGAPEGPVTPPSQSTTTGSTTGQGTTETGGPGQDAQADVGSPANVTSVPAAAFVGVSPRSPHVLEVVVALPAGDHRVILTAASAGSVNEPRQGQPIGGLQPGGAQPRTATPGLEAGVALLAIAAVAMAGARRRR